MKTPFAIFIISLLTLTFLYYVPSSPAEEPEDTYVNPIGMEFVLIKKGTFLMGSNESENASVSTNELPQHRVRITQDFYIGRYEVTQGEWNQLMDENLSENQNDNFPVVNVTWFKAQEFIRKLNDRDPNATYRLPTEAEWEYACRAGTDTTWFFGNDPLDLPDYADMEDYPTHHFVRVGTYEPNPWGLYNIYGNAREWVEDWYSPDYYEESPTDDPTGPTEGKEKILRGGAFCDDPVYCKSARRYTEAPDELSGSFGFRVVMVKKESAKREDQSKKTPSVKSITGEK
ncbi:MAG: formylglycine-generating enzyme family protein [Deltaproteobacteria bacterium]|jgi:formylglycine-generating enzyme required for sulfatase activity|nr:formylglycine-generating enzyme family protein [Deltaproteobacteria bacterium]